MVRALVAALLVAVVFGVAACGHDVASGDPPARGSAGDDPARVQAKFDAERKPEQIVEALGIKPGSRVADIGAGSGLFTVHLARAVKPKGKVVATDIDGAVLELLGHRLDRLGLADVVERRVVAADAPGLEAGAYDAILLAEVDHFFPDPVAWLHAAAGALAPGGRIVITNRIYHRAQSLAAAQKAGLVLKTESQPSPAYFVAVFVPEGAAK